MYSGIQKTRLASFACQLTITLSTRRCKSKHVEYYCAYVNNDINLAHESAVKYILDSLNNEFAIGMHTTCCLNSLMLN